MDPTLLIGGGLGVANAIMGNAANRRAAQTADRNTMMQMALQRWQMQQGQDLLNYQKDQGERAFRIGQDARDRDRSRALYETDIGDRRASVARRDYDEDRAAYRFDRPPSEKEIQSELMTLLNMEDQPATLSPNAIQAIREGRGARLDSIGDKTPDNWVRNLIKARSAALSESTQRNQAHEGRYLPALAASDQRSGGYNTGALGREQAGNKMMIDAIASMAKALENPAARVSQVTNDRAKYDAANPLKDTASILTALRGFMGKSGITAPSIHTSGSAVDYLEDNKHGEF